MHGANVFLDGDILEGHKRLGLGLETKSSLVDLSTNYYQGLTRMKIVDGIAVSYTHLTLPTICSV